MQLPQLEPSPRVRVEKQGPSSSPDFSAEILPAEPVVTTNVDIVTDSRMNCRVTTVEALRSSNGLNSSSQVFQHSIIGVPLSNVASSARQYTGNQSQAYFVTARNRAARVSFLRTVVREGVDCGHSV